jgi:hypothetical protein
MIDMFLEVGFKLVKQEDTEFGYIREYKYYPDYMGDNHYTLVLFTYKIGGDTDWRLYIHRNKDGSYVESPFQLSDFTDRNKVFIKDYFNKIFFAEIRNQKLEKIGI